MFLAYKLVFAAIELHHRGKQLVSYFAYAVENNKIKSWWRVMWRCLCVLDNMPQQKFMRSWTIYLSLVEYRTRSYPN